MTDKTISEPLSKLSEETIYQKINRHKLLGNLYTAAYLSQRAGLKKEAEELYERAENSYENINPFYPPMDSEKEIILTNDLISSYEKTGAFHEAADIAYNSDLTDRARDLYKKVIKGYKEIGDLDRAARIAHRLGLEAELEK